MAGMDPENVKEFGWALAGEEVLTRELTAEQAKIMARLDEDPGAAILGEFELSQADREQLERPELLQLIDESMREQALGGVFGWVDDELAFTRPWGFDLSEISVPVLLRYGSSDVLVPRGHGDWLAQHVPGAVVVMDEAGHLGSDPEQEITENIAWLRTEPCPPQPPPRRTPTTEAPASPRRAARSSDIPEHWPHPTSSEEPPLWFRCLREAAARRPPLRP